MELHDKLKTIKSKEDFITFLKELENDCLSNSSEWENTTINEYLNSISGWLEDVLVDESKINWEQPQWSTIALLFYMGKIYE